MEFDQRQDICCSHLTSMFRWSHPFTFGLISTSLCFLLTDWLLLLLFDLCWALVLPWLTLTSHMMLKYRITSRLGILSYSCMNKLSEIWTRNMISKNILNTLKIKEKVDILFWEICCWMRVLSTRWCKHSETRERSQLIGTDPTHEYLSFIRHTFRV